MNEPLVSVQMITYNHAPHIAQAIEGVLMQNTNFSFELIIGEDFSTDGTRDIVFNYSKRYPKLIRVITSEENVGMHKNYNRTKQACRGKYIAWCEGDDYWQRNDKLQIQVDYMEKNTECGMVYSDCDWHYIKSGYIINNYVKKDGKIPLKTPSIVDIVAKRIDIRTCTVLAKRDLVEKVQNGDLYLHQSGIFKMSDTQLWAELSLITKIHFIEESLSTYQILEESATQSKDGIKALKFWISDSEMYLYLCDKHNLPENLKKRHEGNLRRGLLHLALREKRPELANQTRERFPNLSLIDLVWFYCAKYPFVGGSVYSLRKFLKKLDKVRSCKLNGFLARNGV